MDCPQVPLDFMNEDHAQFIAQRDKLLGLIYSYAPAEVLDQELDALLEHTRKHFAEENRQMIEKHFPPYLTHQSEHERTLLDMEAHIADWKQNRDSDVLQNWLKVTLADWLINHINTMDFVSAWFISEQQ
jgi:hemerythrin